MPNSDEYTCTLNDQMLAKARQELNEEPARRQQDVQHLRDWLDKQSYIISRRDFKFLLMFLRGGKFSLERAKQKIDIFHSLITHCPEQARPEDPFLPSVQQALSCGAFVPLPHRLPDGRGVVLVRAGQRDPAITSQERMFQVSNMISQLWLESDEQLQVCGIVGIIDLQGVTAVHAAEMSPTCVKKAVTIWDAMPVRQKGMHYMNTPPLIDPVLNIIRMFLSEKLKKRIYVHGRSMTSLHEQFPPECLPSEYGGTQGSIEPLVDEWKRRVEANRDYFMAIRKCGVNEKLRPGRPKSTADYLGIEGSFRQLEID